MEMSKHGVPVLTDLPAPRQHEKPKTLKLSSHGVPVILQRRPSDDMQLTKRGVVVRVGIVDRPEHLGAVASWLEGEGWPRRSENLAMFHRSYGQYFHGVFKEDGTLASKCISVNFQDVNTQYTCTVKPAAKTTCILRPPAYKDLYYRSPGVYFPCY